LFFEKEVKIKKLLLQRQLLIKESFTEKGFITKIRKFINQRLLRNASCFVCFFPKVKFSSSRPKSARKAAVADKLDVLIEHFY